MVVTCDHLRIPTLINYSFFHGLLLVLVKLSLFKSNLSAKFRKQKSTNAFIPIEINKH